MKSFLFDCFVVVFEKPRPVRGFFNALQCTFVM